MLAAGAITALFFNAMPVRLPKWKRLVRKTHIKYEALKETSLRRYKVAVQRFFQWRKSAGFSLPNSLSQLDFQASEFINYLYLDERPLGWAGDFVAGIKRLYPRCRKHLDTTGAYYKNWSKATVRVRALPFTPDFVRGLASLALIDKKPRLAAGFLVAFAGLLRIGEVIQLRASNVNCLRPNFSILSFPHSKGAQMKGQTETVIIRDPVLNRVLSVLKASAGDADFIFGGSYREYAAAVSDYANFFNLNHPNLTLHGLRRGGATWHFSVHTSYDKTQCHGRWEQAKQATIYINEAMAESGQASINSEGATRLKTANRVLPDLLKRYF
jgi:integrase